MGANCLANGALRHGKGLGKVGRTDCARAVEKPAPQTSVSTDYRAGLSKPTHTHMGKGTHGAHKNHQNHHRGQPWRQALTPRRACECAKRARVRGLATEAVEVGQLTGRPLLGAWDSGGGRNPCQHALLWIPGLGSGTAIVRDSNPTSLSAAAQQRPSSRVVDSWLT